MQLPKPDKGKNLIKGNAGLKDAKPIKQIQEGIRRSK